MTDQDLPYLIALARTDAYGPNTVRKLLSKLGSAERIWKSGTDALTKAGAGEKSTAKFIERRRVTDPKDEIELLKKTGVQTITHGDPRYPELLKQISDPPFILFVRGNAGILSDSPALAIVGTRSMTRYGETAVRMLCGPLSQAGVPIVSGLAMGVDAEAHATTLRANGKTVAVLAGGVDAQTVGPKENAALAESIAESGGVLVSEFPPLTRPDRFRFPRRNRIIAGMTVGTVVVEAAEKSGALITAECALESNRDVWAVPGPISQSLSAGTNRLLAEGALPAISAQAIVGHYGITPECGRKRPGKLSPVAETIMEFLAKEPFPVDLIIEKTGRQPSETMAALTELELNGHVRRQGDSYDLVVDSLA
ncbi:DNA-processing protein DprA [Candidatus Uhrbacteria bacterium]|nr:DNA-processing protein DprA [Candidatus Uhrbacteria bacterium]